MRKNTTMYGHINLCLGLYLSLPHTYSCTHAHARTLGLKMTVLKAPGINEDPADLLSTPRS